MLYLQLLNDYEYYYFNLEFNLEIRLQLVRESPTRLLLKILTRKLPLACKLRFQRKVGNYCKRTFFQTKDHFLKAKALFFPSNRVYFSRKGRIPRLCFLNQTKKIKVENYTFSVLLLYLQLFRKVL